MASIVKSTSPQRHPAIKSRSSPRVVETPPADRAGVDGASVAYLSLDGKKSYHKFGWVLLKEGGYPLFNRGQRCQKKYSNT
jgi:hypothetical protein